MTTSEIKVKVSRNGSRKYFIAYYHDPVTGKRESQSTKQTRRREAERVAARWEAELRSGKYRKQSRMTWSEFRERYDTEKLSNKSKGMQNATDTVFNHLERMIDPARLSSLTKEVLEDFQKKLRKTGIAETSIGTHLRHLKAALSWAQDEDLIAEVPRIKIPKVARDNMMRGRPIRGEVFERMIAAVPHVRPKDAHAWIHYLNGLWLSGLRLEESTIVSWDEDATFMIDLSGRRPRFRIFAEAHKGRRDMYLPMVPDFAEWLFETPEDQRHGLLFKLNGLLTGKPLKPSAIGRTVSSIGRRALATVDKAAGKSATAHDLRRAFGNRWAPKVTPAVLQQLMRHRDIQTTMKYYIALDADDLADQLWREHSATSPEAKVRTLVRTSQKTTPLEGTQNLSQNGQVVGPQ